MPYTPNTIYAVRKSKTTLGNKLGRLAVDLDFSVTRIAEATGATRQTAYNWLFGGEVLGPYRDRVEKLIRILETSSTAEQAWTKACQEFNRKI